MNLLEFQQRFATEEACLIHLEESRWGVDSAKRFCPHCGSYKTYKFKSGKLFKCGDCRKQFTAKIGTIFSDSKIPLTKWYLAIYLSGSLKKGISSVQLSKYIGVTQKTSWFMLHRIRTVFENTDNGHMLGGGGLPVEIDETYYGKNGHKPGPSNKAAIFGMVERGGTVRTSHVKSAGARVLLPAISNNIAHGSVIYSDQARVYKSLMRRGYQHDSVNHSISEYARGVVSTNTIEGFWSHFKRTIIGTYHVVSIKHLNSYVNETAYRYNTRKFNDGERFEAWFDAAGCRMKYKELIG
jgi:transposase-like protein